MRPTHSDTAPRPSRLISGFPRKTGTMKRRRRISKNYKIFSTS